MACTCSEDVAAYAVASLDYRHSQPGDHAPAQCGILRAKYDATMDRAIMLRVDDPARRQLMRESEDYIGGYHAGWGACRDSWRVSPFVARALTGNLPVKEYAR